MAEARTIISTQAVSTQLDLRSDDAFTIDREFPDDLRPLLEISNNFYWSWRPEGIALFRDLDPELWESVEQNPRSLLQEVKKLRLWKCASDPGYLERLRKFVAEFKDYVSATPNSDASPGIAYFCAEYGVHNSLPNYSGGLGILAGDHLKSASDLNIPLTAIGLLYRFGYFRQKIGHDGWQVESYTDIFDSKLALTPVMDSSGERLTVAVHIRGRQVTAQAWLAKVGRISLYLLDTNVEANSDVDRLITGHLYGGDAETRIVQEKVLGIGGVRLLRKLGISPDVYHLNEGHAAFSTLELAREYIEANSDANFATAASVICEKCVFTTHTPVAAGNDAFEPTLLSQCFSKEFIAAIKLTISEFLALGRADLSDDKEFFGMTPLAIRMCRSSNGVSAKHGEVSRELWLKMFPGIDDAAHVPIGSVTNGVHAPTWVAPLLQNIYTKIAGPNWDRATHNLAEWQNIVAAIPDAEIWHAHQTLKDLLIAYLRNKTRTGDIGRMETIHENLHTSTLFSADVLTIGFARRVAAYKRWELLFSDIDRLLKMVDDPERPVQFIFAGKAHPQDRTAKSILQKLMSINNDSHWQRRAVFIEDYDQDVARYLVHGVDVWLNVPRRPMEASGTSGMKAAMNGVLNCSILDGWWIEGFNDANGFAIGDLDKTLTDDEMDAADREALYETLEQKVIPAYYAKDADGLPGEWIARMRNSLATLTPQFSTDRMVSDYIAHIYRKG